MKRCQILDPMDLGRYLFSLSRVSGELDLACHSAAAVATRQMG